ncbi:MAG TPA: hypothetical protein VFB06_37735 [Streptosporangiaceae bacterium]|nr:hypothetical protein [Streptosporangiaceae bacterium]
MSTPAPTGVIPAEDKAAIAWMIDVIALVRPYHAPGSPFYQELPHLAHWCNTTNKRYRDTLLALYAPVRPLSPPARPDAPPCRVICPWADRHPRADPGAA